MITSAQTSLLSGLRQTPIPKATLIELLARLENRVHSMLLESFNKSGLSQKQIAERLGWDEGRVSRCLGGSGNWTLKTINALMAAIGIDLDDPTYTTFEELERRLRGQTTIGAGVSRAASQKNRSQLQKKIGNARSLGE
jgi:transcriptional regulator with XRE-family HTH domain